MMSFGHLWLLILVIKLVLSYYLPLSADEAYYWVWSNNLSLSYFDHPPMISYWIWLGHIFEFLGGHVVRWPSVILGHFIILIWDYLFKKRLSKKQRFYAWMIFSTHPITGLGSLILTPDLPLMFYFSLSFVFAEKIIKDKRTWDYITLGIILGLGFLSKYHMVLTVPMLLLLLKTREELRVLFNLKILWTILFGILFCLPVLVWNYQNDWISFKFQLNHGLGAKILNWENIITYLLGQAFILHPVMIWVLIRNYKRINAYTSSFLKGSAFIYLFFLYSATKGHVEANWTLQALPALWFIVAQFLNQCLTQMIASTWVILLVPIVTHWVSPWMQYAPDKLNEVHNYQEIIREVRNCPHIFTSSYQSAGLLSYYSKRQVYKVRGVNRPDHFDFISPSINTLNEFCFVGQSKQDLPKHILDTYSFEEKQQFQNGMKLYYFRKQL